MVRNKKVTGKAMSVPGGVAVGTGSSVLISLAGALAMAWLVDSTYLPETGLGYGAMVILLLSSAAGAWIAADLVKHRRLVVCLVTGSLYFLLLLGLTAFFFGGQYQGVAPTALLVAGGSAASALIGNAGQGSREPRRHKPRYG